MAAVNFGDRGIIDIYRDMAEGNKQAMETMLEGFTARCRKHAYRSMVLFTNALIDFYENDLQRHVLAVFREWEEGEASLSSLAIRIGAGQEAAQTGRQLMGELRDALSGMTSQTFPRVSVDTAAPNLDDNDILALKDDIEGLLGAAQRNTEQAVSSANSSGEENNIYYLILPVLENAGMSMTENFRRALLAADEGAGSFLGGVEKTLGSRTHGGTLTGLKQAWPDKNSYL